MFQDARQLGWRLTPESIPLWEQRRLDYVAATMPRGLIGLPEQGATPSRPEQGELVASVGSHPVRDDEWGDGWIRLYADGRLIWTRHNSTRFDTTGVIEQRLTPEGVELVRAEILSTGLFDPGRQLSGDPGRGRAPVLPSFFGGIEVRDGDRLVFVSRRRGQDWTPAFDRLHDRLRNLWAWLPASAWEDAEMRPYVPSQYEVCLVITMGTEESLRQLEYLPRGRDLVALAWEYALGQGQGSGLAPEQGLPPTPCLGFSTADALDLNGAIEGTAIHVSLRPYLPDGLVAYRGGLTLGPGDR
jgi:hypothetical protein